MVDSTFRNGATSQLAIFSLQQKEKLSPRFPMHQFVVTKVYNTLLLLISFQNTSFSDNELVFFRNLKTTSPVRSYLRVFYNYSSETAFIPLEWKYCEKMKSCIFQKLMVDIIKHLRTS